MEVMEAPPTLGDVYFGRKYGARMLASSASGEAVRTRAACAGSFVNSHDLSLFTAHPILVGSHCLLGCCRQVQEQTW